MDELSWVVVSFVITTIVQFVVIRYSVKSAIIGAYSEIKEYEVEIEKDIKKGE
ncbi:MAG: hypothetical protein FWE25_07230 [Lachnospiraceae bacterium]|nr:hypothetical protein [Lachnospiraceae bacterium]